MFCLPLRYWTLDDRQVLDGRKCAAQWRVCLCSQWINSLGIKRIYCYCDIWWKRWWLVNISKVGSWFGIYIFVFHAWFWNLNHPGMSTRTQQLHWHIVCRCITAITLIDHHHTGPVPHTYIKYTSRTAASPGNCEIPRVGPQCYFEVQPCWLFCSS